MRLCCRLLKTISFDDDSDITIAIPCGVATFGLAEQAYTNFNINELLAVLQLSLPTQFRPNIRADNELLDLVLNMQKGIERAPIKLSQSSGSKGVPLRAKQMRTRKDIIQQLLKLV